jgi:CBS domain-containing protein
MDHSISGAPVIGTDGSMVGVVSETDIVRYDSTEDHIQEPDHLHDYYMHSLEKRVNRESLNGFHIEEANTTLVRDIMTPMVFSVPQETTVVAAAGEMVRGRIHRLFVTSDKDIVGVISALDMLRVLAEL